LNNLEIIFIKLSSSLIYGVAILSDLTSLRDIYNNSKIYYYLLNNPEFINDIQYPTKTVFIVNKNNYPVDFIQKITSAIIGNTHSFDDGDVIDISELKNIPKGIQFLTYMERDIYLHDEDVVFDVDVFTAPDGSTILLHPVYTEFYINIGYLTVEYISNDEAKNEFTKYMKHRGEIGKILSLLELKYNTPESLLRLSLQYLGERYNTKILKPQFVRKKMIEYKSEESKEGGSKRFPFTIGKGRGKGKKNSRSRSRSTRKKQRK
jgi:hypothetical protein